MTTSSRTEFNLVTGLGRGRSELFHSSMLALLGDSALLGSKYASVNGGFLSLLADKANQIRSSKDDCGWPKLTVSSLKKCAVDLEYSDIAGGRIDVAFISKEENRSELILGIEVKYWSFESRPLKERTTSKDDSDKEPPREPQIKHYVRKNPDVPILGFVLDKHSLYKSSRDYAIEFTEIAELLNLLTDEHPDRIGMLLLDYRESIERDVALLTKLDELLKGNEDRLGEIRTIIRDDRSYRWNKQVSQFLSHIVMRRLATSLAGDKESDDVLTGAEKSGVWLVNGLAPRNVYSWFHMERPPDGKETKYTENLWYHIEIDRDLFSQDTKSWIRLQLRADGKSKANENRKDEELSKRCIKDMHGPAEKIVEAINKRGYTSVFRKVETKTYYLIQWERNNVMPTLKNLRLELDRFKNNIEKAVDDIS